MTVQDGLDIQVPQPALLFDLDGTLVDSVYQHVIAWQEALATCGIELSVWRIHRRIGMSGGLFIDALSRETGVRLDEELSGRLRELHAQAYLRRHETVLPLPGARELLAHLHERQVPFAIATSGARHTAGSALALLGLPDDVPVVTRDLVERAKPDPHLFLAAARRLSGSTRRTASWWATASGTCWPHSGPVPWAADCSRVATAARSWSGPARTASTPTRPRC